MLCKCSNYRRNYAASMSPALNSTSEMSFEHSSFIEIRNRINNQFLHYCHTCTLIIMLPTPHQQTIVLYSATVAKCPFLLANGCVHSIKFFEREPFSGWRKMCLNTPSLIETEIDPVSLYINVHTTKYYTHTHV